MAVIMRLVLFIGFFCAGCTQSSTPLERSSGSDIPAAESPMGKSTASVAEKNEPEIVSIRSSSDEEPVAVSLKISRKRLRAGESFDISVLLEIAPQYEIHDLQAPPPAVATLLELKLPLGFQTLEEWLPPDSVRSVMPDGHPVYIGQVGFKRKVQIGETIQPGDYDIGCTIGYQACNSRQCLRPVRCELPAKITIQP